jgi:2-enoate reductase
MDRGGVQCTTNPIVGREKLVTFAKTGSPQKVVIVGAGPGGLEAGLRAKQMGHDVVIYEKHDVIGGEMISASIPDFKWDIKRLLSYYREEIKRVGLEVRTSTTVTLDTLKDEDPDVVILATGGEAIIPDAPGIERDNVVTAIDAIVRWDDLNIGKRVMVLGAGLVGYEAAWFAAQQGRSVVLVSRRSDEDVVQLKEHGTNLALLIKGVRDAGVIVLGNRELKRVEEKGVVLVKDDGTEEFHNTDSLIISRGYTPRKGLKRDIEAANLRCEVYEVGDCLEVRNFFDAINEGAHVVREKLA